LLIGMSEMKGEVGALPAAQTQLGPRHSIHSDISGERKEGEQGNYYSRSPRKKGEPGNYYKRSPLRKGEPCQKSHSENEEWLDRDSDEVKSLDLGSQGEDGISDQKLSNESLTGLEPQPGSPEYLEALGKDPVAKEEKPKSKSLKNFCQNSIPKLSHELYQWSPHFGLSTEPKLSDHSGVSLPSNSFSKNQLMSPSFSQCGIPVRSQNHNGDLLVRRERGKHRRSSSLRALDMFKKSARIEPKSGDLPLVGAFIKRADSKLPIEQQLRRMRKLRQKRKKRRAKSEDFDISLASTTSNPDFRHRISYKHRERKRSSMSLYPIEKTEHKRSVPSLSFCPFVGPEDIKKKLKDIHGSKNPRKLHMKRASRTGFSSKQLLNCNNTNPKRHVRASSITFCSKDAERFKILNSRRIRKHHANAKGHRVAKAKTPRPRKQSFNFENARDQWVSKAKTPRPRVQSLNLEHDQTQFVFPNFRSPNLLKHDPGWSQVISKSRKLKEAVQFKFAQLPSWNAVDDKFIHSKTLLCFLCNVQWEYEDSIVTLPCMHFYHRKCISFWLQNSENCPQCKMSILQDGSNVVS
jgi:hypothetical protein